MLSFFRRLTALRQSEPALFIGDYRPVETSSPDTFAYLRTHGDDAFLIVLNFGAQGQQLSLSVAQRRAEIVLSTRMDVAGAVDPASLFLRPNEGIIVRL
jgi:oligo-1,6-glucosidase